MTQRIDRRRATRSCCCRSARCCSTTDSIERFRTGYRELFGSRRRRPALRGGVSAGAAPCRHGALAAAVPRAAGDAVRLLPRARSSGSTTRSRRRSTRGSELIADYYDARAEDRRQGRHARRRRLQAGAARAALSRAARMGRAARAATASASSPASTRRPRRRTPSTRRPPATKLRPGAHGAGRQPVRRGARPRRRPPTRPAAGSWSPATPRARRPPARICCSEHGVTTPVPVADYAMVPRPAGRRVGVAVLPLEHGFVPTAWRSSPSRTSSATGCRGRPAQARGRRALHRRGVGADAAATWSSIVDHGIGRYEGLETLEVAGRAARLPASCIYAGGDKLFVPVENIEVLSPLRRRGRRASQLDRLGGVAWQSRKARLKQRIARHGRPADPHRRRARSCSRGEAMSPPEGLYEEFCARFPYAETDDQLHGDRRRARRPGVGQADGPADLRRRRLRQDRGGAARRLRRGHGGQAGRGGRADDAAGAPALPTFTERFAGPAGADRAGCRAWSPAKEAKEIKDGARRTARSRSSIGTHALLGQERRVQGPRPGDRRRGAAFRRRAQGAAEGAARRRACADADRDADPAHPAAGAVRRARDEPHRHAAGRPPGGAHLRHAVRPA